MTTPIPTTHIFRCADRDTPGFVRLPGFMPGDTITIDPDITPGPGDLVAVEINGNVTLRQWDSFPPEFACTVIGVAVFLVRTLR